MENAHSQVVRLTSRGRLTIPRPMRDEVGIKPGDAVYFVATERGIQMEHVPQAEIEGWLAQNGHDPEEAISVHRDPG